MPPPNPAVAKLLDRVRMEIAKDPALKIPPPFVALLADSMELFKVIVPEL